MTSINRVVDCMSDDKLRDIAFGTFLRRVTSLLLSGANMSDPAIEKQVEYAAHFLWEVFRKSNSSLKQTFANYIAGESRFIMFTLEAMCTYLESYCKLCIDLFRYRTSTRFMSECSKTQNVRRLARIQILSA